MEEIAQIQKGESTTQDYPFLSKKGDIPFWDHPSLKGNKVLPTKYYRPYTNIEGVMEHFLRGKLTEEDFTILKVLGDAVCANENQLRRYMAPKLSPSQTSTRLDRLRANGFVDRWKVRIYGEEESVKPPAPFTLGMSGFKLLKHFYNADFFMDSNRWDSLGIGGIKRYVAMNELRCQMIERKILKKWKWHPVIAGNVQNHKPFGVGVIDTPQGNMNFLIDRVQSNQNFIGYFRDRLFNWKKLYERDGFIRINGFPDYTPYVIIYTSTRALAEHINQELLLDTFPYHIWLCVEEDLIEDGFNKSFYMPLKDKIQRFQLDF